MNTGIVSHGSGYSPGRQVATENADAHATSSFAIGINAGGVGVIRYRAEEIAGGFVAG